MHLKRGPRAGNLTFQNLFLTKCLRRNITTAIYFKPESISRNGGRNHSKWPPRASTQRSREQHRRTREMEGNRTVSVQGATHFFTTSLFDPGGVYGPLSQNVRFFTTLCTTRSIFCQILDQTPSERAKWAHKWLYIETIDLFWKALFPKRGDTAKLSLEVEVSNPHPTQH